MTSDEPNELYQQLMNSSNKSREELELLVKKKQEKFSGLLTESGALFLVAKELGTNVGESTAIESEIKETSSISELKAGMKVNQLTAKIVSVYPPKSFERSGKTGHVQNVLISDDSGSITWTVWNEDVEKWENEKVGKNSTIQLGPLVVKEKDSRLSVQFYSPQGHFSIIEKAIQIASGLLDITPTSTDIVVEAKLEKKFPVKTFSTNNRNGQLARFVLSEGDVNLTGVAWNDAALQMELIPLGSKIRIENAYAKSGLNGEIELHAGWTTRISVLEKGIEIQKTEKSLANIHPDEVVLVKGQLKELDPIKTVFDACSKCNSKVNLVDEKWVCAKCGETSVNKKAIARFVLADETGHVLCVAFGNEAEKIWGQTAQTLSEAGVEHIEEFAKGKNGQIVRVEGKATLNHYSGALEVKVNRVQF